MAIWKGMTDRNGNAVALKSLHWEGAVNDLVLTLKTRQVYRNDASGNIEAVYTFPVSWNAVVSRFAIELDGKILTAQAMPKKQAEDRYEDAIESGDTPVMLEYSRDGLCTANLGNIQPGETVVVEIETVKILTWDNGKVRIAVPTVIANRYSPDGSQGNLLPHQQVSTNFLAEYPVDFHLTLKGLLASGEVDVPQHTARIEKTPAGVDIDLKRAFANKDIVITIENVQPVNRCVFAPDPITDGRWAGFCTFTPMHNALTVNPARMKILVDCSGSMNGSSIHLAKHALQSLADSLTDDDVVTLSCFGSRTEHKIRQPSPCTRRFIRQNYKPVIDGISANMGGTDMDEALQEVIRLGIGIFNKYTADILMITDGEVWQVDRLVDIVRHGNHRIFIIGVGVAPGENLLRRLAEATGGACEMVLPTEDMDEVVSRMLARMRLAQLSDIAVTWQEQPVWHSPIPKNAYLGESITISAIFDKAPVSPVSISCRLGDDVIAANAGCHTINDGGQLAKAAVNEQVKTLDDDEAQTDLAVRYSLIGERTNLILVHERDANRKAKGMPALHKVPQMALDDIAVFCRALPSAASKVSVASMPGGFAGLKNALFAKGAAIMRSVSDERFLADMAVPCETATDTGLPPEDFVKALNQVDWQDKAALLDIVDRLPVTVVKVLENSGVDSQTDPYTALILLAAWLIGPASSIATRSLVQHVTAELDKLPEPLIKAVHEALDRAFPDMEEDGWDDWA